MAAPVPDSPQPEIDPAGTAPAMSAIRRALEEMGDTPWLWGMLAERLTKADRTDQAIEAVLRAAELQPDAAWRLRLCQVLARACRVAGSEAALVALQDLALDLACEAQLALALTDMGRPAEAAGLWRRLLEAEPRMLEAHEHLARLQQPSEGLRIAVVGSCQAFSVAEGLRRRVPGVRVGAYFRKIRSEGEQAWLRRELSGYDVLVGQPGRLPPFDDELTARPVVPIPSVAFSGFHPDLERVENVGAHFKAWASLVVMAAFLLELSPARAADLFNAFTYGSLGYFDEHPKAQAALDASYRAAGMEPPRLGGVFVHVPNHPTSELTWEIAGDVTRRLGLADLGGEPPQDLGKLGVVWPVYPEIARRIGVPGSLDFHSSTGQTLDLDEMIADSYALFASSGERLQDKPRVVAAADALRPIL